MTLSKRHMGRRVAAVGAAVSLLVLGLASPAYAAVPTIASVTPTTASRDCQITITGTGFTTPDVSQVTIGGANGTDIQIDSATQLEVRIPTGTPPGQSNPATVIVVNGSSPPASGSSSPFTYSTGADATCPGVPTFSPSSGIVGSTVTISGAFNSIVTGVRFNTSSLVTPTNPSTSGATAVVPAGATTGRIHVYTAAGQRTSATNFTVSESHSRSVTLKLKKRLVASGDVSVGDGFTACVASVPVKIQRKSGGGWKNVGSTTTSASGSYKKKIKDKDGKYRARAAKVGLNNGVDLCLQATSSVRRHN